MKGKGTRESMLCSSLLRKLAQISVQHFCSSPFEAGKVTSEFINYQV
jgi:hypothetical protein